MKQLKEENMVIVQDNEDKENEVVVVDDEEFATYYSYIFGKAEKV